jgi:hypothetical protein
VKVKVSSSLVESQRSNAVGHTPSVVAAPFFADLNRPYGVTLIVKMLLTTVPIVAVIFTLPLVVTVEALMTTPADTVARLLSLVFQVATSATGKEPLQVTAVAVNVSVKLLPVNGEALVGIWIWLIHPTVTVTVCVPVAAGF